MRAWGSSSAGGSACNPADRLDHGSKPEQQKRGRLRCRSGSWTSGRERRGEGLGGCAAVLADRRKRGPVRDEELRMIEGRLREADPLVGEGFEEGDQVRLVGRAQAEIPDALIEVVDVRLVEVPAPGVEVHDLLE